MTRTSVKVEQQPVPRVVAADVADTAVAAVGGVNEVRLVGRVNAEPDSRELPSGDVVVQLRVVVTRAPAERRTGRTAVDTIDVACWSASARRAALRQRPGDVVEVVGSLRRRFYRAGPVTQSRYEVEATTVRRHRAE